MSARENFPRRGVEGLKEEKMEADIKGCTAGVEKAEWLK